MFLNDLPMLIELHMSNTSYPIKWDTIVAMATKIVTYYIPLVQRLEEVHKHCSMTRDVRT